MTKKLTWFSVLTAALLLSATGVRRAHAEKHEVNACGCYSNGNTCFCEKGAKCGCPGNCEPKGCEEARQKQLEKEIAAETKRAKEAEEKARSEAKQEAKPVEEDESKAPVAPKMTASQKKQLQKLLDAYLADHPDAKQKTLTEIRGDL
jgi:hypothetical protein